MKKKKVGTGIVLCIMGGLVFPELAVAGGCWGSEISITAASFKSSKNTTTPGREKYMLGSINGSCSIDNGTVYHDRVHYYGMNSGVSGCSIQLTQQSPQCIVCANDSAAYHSMSVYPFANNVVLNCPAGTIQHLNTNTILARAQFTFTGNDYKAVSSYLTFKLYGTVDIGTCNVKGVDNSTVELPPVPRSALAVGTGRYTDVWKDFTYTLECTNKPKVNLKFSSANQMIVGTDDVLSNTTPGNPDVGFQVYYNNAALKFGDNKALITSTQKDEQLKFTAYYYRKSTNVNAGVITSNAEFTFTYE